ncbi:2-oxoacid:acceptor oxidoreductase family protein, partial [Methylobacterium frigidaeris]
RRFAEGLQGLVVIEEKRSLVEAQIKDVLFNLPADRRPAIEGKRDRYGAPLIPATLELSPEQLAGIVASFAGRFGVELGSRTPGPPPASPAPAAPDLLSRRPFFCSGCPHNTSTRVPAGSFAAGGIGCHIMALGTRSTETFCQMGGEGIQWVGLSTFTDMPHLFVNLGDGTYQHSGSLAIRQAVAAGTTVTYKILYNDAVAMTGGQPVEGQLTVRDIVAQVSAEGVRHVAVVADDPGRHRGPASLPDGVELHHRDALDAVQRDFRTRKGVSVIVYDQTCAAEKRRRRKRKEHPDPPERVLINPAVCEGCGDCSVQSNCISVEPLDTELGRKRRINQSACNKDYSCLKGFCPSFVSVTGVTPRKPDTSRAAEAETRLAAALRRPARPALGEDRPFRVLVTGIGGTGVVTIGGILSMAAHLDGLEASTLDFTGVAQKNGAVISHVQIADRGAPISAVRIGEADCDLMLGCDIVVAASAAVKPRLARTRTAAVVNRDITPTADFVTQGDRPIAGDAHERAVRASIAPANLFF